EHGHPPQRGLLFLDAPQLVVDHHSVPHGNTRYRGAHTTSSRLIYLGRQALDTWTYAPSGIPRYPREVEAMSRTPIGDYALLSDRHPAALVGRDGSVDWLCFPRFDGPSVFARLLDEDAGHWSIRPSVPYQVSRRYLDRTMVQATTFRTETGTVTV